MENNTLTRQDVRFALIDHYLTWYGHLKAEDIAKVLKIARPNAQALIKKYELEKNKDGKERIKRLGKGKVSTEHFKPPKEFSDARRFLDHIRAQNLAEEYFNSDQCWDRNFVELENLELIGGPNKPNFKVVQQIAKALKYNYCLEIDYQSRKSLSEKRLISPSRLVYVLNRYHLRAYSYTSTGWRDFVLTRILKASKSDSKIPWIEPSKDSDWSKKVELTFAPNPELPSDIVETLEMDYPIENGELKVITNLLTKFMLKEDSVSETLNQINVTGTFG